MLIKKILLAVSLTLIASCGGSQNNSSYDPMTGQSVRTIRAPRVMQVSGHTPAGVGVLTGTTNSIQVRDVKIAQDHIEMSVLFQSSYGGGLVAGGSPTRCVDSSLRVGIEGSVVELQPSGSVQDRDIVTGRSYGQATVGNSSTSQRFVISGDNYASFMSASSVIIEYCDIVGRFSDASLDQIQGRNL